MTWPKKQAVFLPAMHSISSHPHQPTYGRTSKIALGRSVYE